MKTNKLAAGALALALGLGAVTPAFAESTSTPDAGKGEVLITSDYRKAETEYVKAFQDYTTKVNEESELKAIRDEKEAAKVAANKAIDDYNKKLDDYAAALAANNEEQVKTLAQFKVNGGYVDDDGNLVVNPTVIETEVQSQQANKVDYEGLVDRKAEIEKERDAYINGGATLDNLREVADRAQEAYEEAQANYKRAKEATKVAKEAYESAKQPFIDAGADRNTIGLAEKYGDVSYVTEGKTDDSESKDDDTDAKEAIEAAEAALEDAKVTAKGAQLLLDSYPETVKTVRDDLVKLLAEQKGIIEKLEDVLKAAKGESVALSDILFSTAYAAEGEEESDTIEELKKATKDLEENTQAIKDKLAENEEANKIANEEAENGADDDNEPADTDDKNEPADKDDKTNADVNTSDKNEEEPAEKTETKTEVKTVKKPAKNAKTGVVGVAGVAGVLAAASVAYAASKKNN